MEFSDQEEQLTNSAETPETGETGSAEDASARQTEAEAPDMDVISSQEDSESSGLEDSAEIDSTETASAELEPESDSPAASKTDSQEITEQDTVEDQPPGLDQPLNEQQDDDSPMEEVSLTEGQAEPEPAETRPDAPEEDSVELDLSFLDQDQADQAEDEDDGRSWYVVHCYSGYENKVRHNLEQRIETMGMKNMIFDIVVPTEEEIEVKEGKRRTVERRVFPGYILVNMIMTEESWYVVRNTPGVTGFVGMGNTPTPLRTEEVSQIIKRMEADAPRIKVTFKSGERVRIVDGPFNDFRGTVSEIDMERAKVRVMVNFFGRETPVELDFLQVEKT